MTVYVYRDGELVEKRPVGNHRPFSFPTPAVSRFAPMESPVTGKEISSWRERERDMAAVGAVDPRDLPRKPFEKRKLDNERQREIAPERGGADPT